MVQPKYVVFGVNPRLSSQFTSVFIVSLNDFEGITHSAEAEYFCRVDTKVSMKWLFKTCVKRQLSGFTGRRAMLSCTILAILSCFCKWKHAFYQRFVVKLNLELLSGQFHVLTWWKEFESNFNDDWRSEKECTLLNSFLLIIIICILKICSLEGRTSVINQGNLIFFVP